MIDNKKSEKKILVNHVALNLAMGALAKPNVRKEYSLNNNFFVQKIDDEHD